MILLNDLSTEYMPNGPFPSNYRLLPLIPLLTDLKIRDMRKDPSHVQIDRASIISFSGLLHKKQQETESRPEVAPGRIIARSKVLFRFSISLPASQTKVSTVSGLILYIAFTTIVL